MKTTHRSDSKTSTAVRILALLAAVTIPLGAATLSDYFVITDQNGRLMNGTGGDNGTTLEGSFTEADEAFTADQNKVIFFNFKLDIPNTFPNAHFPTAGVHLR